jgi:hypothetical protein
LEPETLVNFFSKKSLRLISLLSFDRTAAYWHIGSPAQVTFRKGHEDVTAEGEKGKREKGFK